MYKALWIQNFVQGRTKHNQVRVKDYIIMIKWQKAKISESLDDLNTVLKSGLTLTFEHVNWKSIGIIYLLGATPAASLVLIKLGSKEGFDLDLWTCDLKINRDNLLNEGNPCTKVLIKWRGQKILSGQHTGLRRVVWPWPLNMWPENQ